MRKYKSQFLNTLGVLALFARDARAQGFVRIDMDASTAAIDTTLAPVVGGTFTVGVWLDLTAGFPAGVGSYSVSVNFDMAELGLAPLPTSQPPYVQFPVLPNIVGLSAGPGEVGSFNGGSSDLVAMPGPTSGLHKLGAITFKVNSVLNDGLFDVTPVLTAFDGFGNNLGDDVTGAFGLKGGQVVPEPSVYALLALGGLLLAGTVRRSTG